jgi:hypothetical protein
MAIITRMMNNELEEPKAGRSCKAHWNIWMARDTAWTNPELPWRVRDRHSARQALFQVLEYLSNCAGRGLIIPV